MSCPATAPTTNITYISLLVRNPEDPNPIARRVRWLFQLLEAGLPLVLFVDTYYAEFLKGDERAWPTLRVIPCDLSQLSTFRLAAAAAVRKGAALTLPPHRNHPKDTEYFCTLMHTKTELVQMALQWEGGSLIQTPFSAFLDCSIAKVLKGESADSLRALRDLQIREDVNHVIIPGCHSLRTVPLGELCAKICWIFCGGFFIVPTARVVEWNMLCQDALMDVLEAGCITWEVNTWVRVAEKAPGLIYWFPADHDVRMLTIPTCLQVEKELLTEVEVEAELLEETALQAEAGYSDEPHTYWGC